jgi:hypothetical protein
LVAKFNPFFFHCKPGIVPPLTGIAVIVTGLPVQKVVEGVVIEMLTGRFGVTVITAWLLVEGLPKAHASEEERMQVTISLLLGI